MKFSLTPRLHLYHTILSNYDLIDKYINFAQINLASLHTTIDCNVCESTRGNVFEFVCKEILMSKKTYVKKSAYRLNLKALHFVTSVRKKYMYYYLELLLNSVFSVSKVTFLLDSNSRFCILQTPIVFSNNFFYSHANLETKASETLFNFSFNYQTLRDLQLIKSCLFLPKL